MFIITAGDEAIKVRDLILKGQGTLPKKKLPDVSLQKE